MTHIDICNQALSMLGIPKITSYDDTSNQAKLCKQFFPVLRDRLLRDHTWSFATAAAKLQKLDEESFDPELPYVCGLPTDCLRVVSLDDEDAPFRRIGKKIHIDYHPAGLIYIRRMEDCNDFDEIFSEALQYLLAVEIGMAMTRDAQLINLYRQEYEKRLQSARTIDAQENSHTYQRHRHSGFLAARRGMR